ncbi:hypothetical protein [Pseudogemmobacter faecipullorum]|uniref:DUF4365 domain-containing protein n=1 Tax=Pseudogemmobacter faecipullorum TaxID=2755041 RepID=A0ABS8CS90_9RHOB|nr:hypothetical protein [Pseudogemmobacter faecipullorum]MCB5412020.1 hypothetical protein [Pseudogemmobacter faecipullorum]
MKAEISEFSYGFALTNELVGWLALSAAPVFPSLIEEGKAGGGYDVKLDRPGVPLFLQFKRSHCMIRRTAREYRAVVATGGALNVPYYRFPITEASTSDQHEMMLALDDGSNLVFYAAPRFHQIHEINQAWSRADVARRSLFVAPSTIGTLDDEQHHVAFDGANTWLCSEPRALGVLTSRGLEDRLISYLKEHDKPLGERLPSLVTDLHATERRGREKAELRRSSKAPADLRDPDRALETKIETSELLATGGEERVTLSSPEPDPPASREPKPLVREAAMLRQAADIAAHVFEAQMIIVQPR